MRKITAITVFLSLCVFSISVSYTHLDVYKRQDEYSGIDHDDRNDSFIFYVAHEVATDILDILRAMN